MSKSFHVHMNYSGSVVLKDKSFNDLAKFLHFYDYLPFEEDLALYLNNLKFPLPRMICTKFDWNCRAGSGGEDFLFDINISEFGFPYCGPSRPPGTMIWRNLNLHSIRKLSCKYDLNSLYPTLIYINFDWNWPAGSGEDVFQYKHMKIWFSPIVAPPDPRGP
jgi:hypothetical protein